MIEHESDLWPERRWGVFMPPHKQGVIEAKPFTDAMRRDEWFAAKNAAKEALEKAGVPCP